MNLNIYLKTILNVPGIKLIYIGEDQYAVLKENIQQI